jgi:hypothetical protein
MSAETTAAMETPRGTEGAAARIEAEVTAWPGVTAAMGKRGEYGFNVGRRQIGHLHGDRAAHFAFPKSQWAELLAAGRIETHPVDRPGLGARRLRSDEDVDETIALMRLNYERATTDGDS